MLNKFAQSELSFYLCPTEKRKTFSSAEEPLDRQKHQMLQKETDEKNFKTFAKKKLPVKKEFVSLQSQLQGAQEMMTQGLGERLRLLKKL